MRGPMVQSAQWSKGKKSVGYGRNSGQAEEKDRKGVEKGDTLTSPEVVLLTL